MQSQIIPILMIQSLLKVTDVLDPGRERDVSIEHSVLYPKNYLFVGWFLSDLKSHRISSLWTFFINSCGLRRKTKAVML